MLGKKTHADAPPAETFTLEAVRGSTLLQASAIGKGSLVEVRAEIDDESGDIDLLITRSRIDIDAGRVDQSSADISLQGPEIEALAGILTAVATKAGAVLS